MEVLTKSAMEKFVSMGDIMSAVENAYVCLKNGDVVLPDRQFMETANGGDLLTGPSLIKGSGFFGAKVSSFSPLNTNMPRVNGVFVLFNESDGTVASIMDSEVVTAHRTAAKSSVAAKYLARKESRKLGVLGMGTQALLHVRYLCEVFDIDEVFAWTRSPGNHLEFQELVRGELGLKLSVVAPDEVTQNTDILVDATYSKTPLIASKSIRKGTLVIGINHMTDAIEFGEELFDDARVFVDYTQNRHAGTLRNAKEKGRVDFEKIVELKDVIGEERYRVGNDEIVYFQSGGVSIEDLAAAISIYKQSKQV